MTISFYTGSAWSEVQVLTPAAIDPPGRPEHVSEAFIYFNNNWKSIHYGGGSITCGYHENPGEPTDFIIAGYSESQHLTGEPIGSLNRGGKIGASTVWRLAYIYDAYANPDSLYYELQLTGTLAEDDIAGIRLQLGDGTWIDLIDADSHGTHPETPSAPARTSWYYFDNVSPGWIETLSYEFKLLR